jgi:hypothetical protein
MVQTGFDGQGKSAYTVDSQVGYSTDFQSAVPVGVMSMKRRVKLRICDEARIITWPVEKEIIDQFSEQGKSRYIDGKRRPQKLEEETESRKREDEYYESGRERGEDEYYESGREKSKKHNHLVCGKEIIDQFSDEG